MHAAAADIEAGVRRAGHELEGLAGPADAAPGVELIVGVVNDRSFGPVVACGAGGTVAELIKDVSVRITPLSDEDAQEMIRCAHTPDAGRLPGAPAVRPEAVEDVLLRVSAHG